MRRFWTLAPFVLWFVGCQDRDKLELRKTVERQASQLRRIEEAVGDAMARSEQAELSLSMLQAEARNPVQVHLRNAEAREALRRSREDLRRAQEVLRER